MALDYVIVMLISSSRGGRGAAAQAVAYSGISVDLAWQWDFAPRHELPRAPCQHGVQPANPHEAGSGKALLPVAGSRCSSSFYNTRPRRRRESARESNNTPPASLTMYRCPGEEQAAKGACSTQKGGGFDFSLDTSRAVQSRIRLFLGIKHNVVQQGRGSLTSFIRTHRLSTRRTTDV
jgi:hypothetical protein